MTYRTKTGRVLTDADIEALADEAERGYDTGSVVYTDGACLGNPGPGGWAWTDGNENTWGSEPSTTNQRMELRAVLEAVLAHPRGELEIVSDSAYVVNCFLQQWWRKWLRMNWTTSKKKPVANRDLWEPLVETVLARGNVRFRKVKGHAGVPMNELADVLATHAAREGDSGREPQRAARTSASLDVRRA